MTNRRESLTAGGHCDRPHGGSARASSAATFRNDCDFGRSLPPPILAVVLPIQSAVDCRIQVLDEKSLRTVTVAGRLGDAHIPDLMIACGEISPALRVDLTDVVSADAIAVEALRRLRSGGAQIVGAPKYIELKLDALSSRPR